MLTFIQTPLSWIMTWVYEIHPLKERKEGLCWTLLWNQTFQMVLGFCCCHIPALQNDNFSSSSPNSPLCLFRVTFYIPTDSSSHIENKTSLILLVTAIHKWLLSKKGLLLWFLWIFNLLYCFNQRDPRVG